jgi:hypothetical protein
MADRRIAEHRLRETAGDHTIRHLLAVGALATFFAVMLAAVAS